MATNGDLIQRDWQSRELVEVVQLNVLQIADFLNKFDLSMRYKLSHLNERLNKLKRTLEYCEEAFRSTMGESGDLGHD